MKSLEILPGIEIAGLTLNLKKSKTLVFADLHLGFEEYLNKQGILVPRFQYSDIIQHLEKILKKTRPETIVINGDLKHEFGSISRQEWNEVLNFLDFLKDYEIKLVKGNHDNILGPIADKKNVDVVPNYAVGSIYITHGNEIPDDKKFKESKIIIIAHDHVALGLRDETRTEKVKCFLLGKFRNKKLIAIPSLNFITEGVDVLQQKLLSPFMQQDLGDFRVFVVEKNEVMDFGRLDKLLTI